ncbi:hypothetical protein [Chitinophaga nivalis]|uniref:Big-1 domain-containing protein n=1 Tax=Chitinophaga nivalis TaxID=2991709 RepID=A0ABT3IJC3_9BACT|nr:hypothetical protein [Chitinophaga nivalis]MCW3466262.1 hypothetical protein [Chitinophaga nivalis]MCW3484047.1 hypothetical protein [Chitinophaga nivalis]
MIKYSSLLLMYGVLLSACQKKDALKADDIMTVSLTKDSVIADNVTYAEIVAMVNISTEKTTRNIKFETNAGTFVNNTGQYTTTIGIDGKATAYLKYDKPGKATVKVTVNDTFTREIPVYFIAGISPDSIMTLDVIKDNQPADNFTYATVVVKSKDPTVVNTLRTVTFTVDKGLFSNDAKSYTTNTTLDGVATAYIKCAQPDAVNVKAVIGSSYSREIQLHFEPALPDYLNIDMPGQLKNALDANTVITTTLTRLKGTVSAGQPVTFTAFRATGEPIGTFLNQKLSNATGEAQANFWVQDTSYAGIVVIKATVKGNGGVVTGSNQLLITK